MSNWIVYGIGFLAQILFSGRLIVQWILSEKKQAHHYAVYLLETQSARLFFAFCLRPFAK